jgi:uncharacterized RDD family membrane protein YckC
MDRTLDVRTPESIEFSYDLAGVGSRFLAVVLDLCIQVALALLAIWGLTFAAGHSTGHVTYAHADSKLVLNIGIALMIAIFFMIFFGYFIFFEALWNGQTPGKKALGIRVVRDGGYPMDWGASFVRNLIRVGETILGFYAVSVIVAILSPQNKRIGDLAAGTIVVRDSRVDAPGALLEEMRAPIYASTAYVSGEERELIRRFLDRRSELSWERRKQLATQLADRVRPRVPPELSRLPDEDLLERL